MVADVPNFLVHHWGHESFIFTMSCIKGREKEMYVQELVTFQGFLHSFQLVILGCIPQLVGDADNLLINNTPCHAPIPKIRLKL